MIPSDVNETASKIPPTGFNINPETPLKIPLKIPLAPDFLISETGLVNTPVIPEKTPFPILITPYPTPSMTVFGLLAQSLFLYFKYSLSIDNDVNPDAKEFVIFDTELKAPAAVILTKDEDPLAIPYTPSNGPFTNPSFGYW